MKHLFLIKQFILYKLKASSAHGIHSPFVFDFIQTVLKDQRHFYAFDDIREIRNILYEDTTILNIEDFGAGSLHGSFKQRMVKDIAKNAGRNEKFGKLLFRIVDKYQVVNILELGTSLGLGSSYLAKAALNGQLVTIEGSREISSYANNTFNNLQLNNIQQYTGNFDTMLQDVLKQHPSFDLIFVDGNHREEATLNYFNQFFPFIHENTILIFDDIHWSEGMNNAWEQIRKDERVLLSIDLFFFGIVFFRKEFKEKQHFILKY